MLTLAIPTAILPLSGGAKVRRSILEVVSGGSK
jgi:hypothetical protein